ncbi:hypothetical protein [Phyllobacterium leguminum]|uniref:Lambda family phage tail tape measure protein n=1 Tax=Phyllobacterium leguminum TaxID=314237 RepID=A0A318T278_9HYPH|nr:hypothetical protein [Phyllobacterium leguminum]PYE86917.1 hypothetical protein C7477_11855 [Phyllobacterium leguminum]
MAEKLGEALLEIRTDDKDFSRGVDQAEKRANRLGRTFDMTAAGAVKLGANLGLAAAAGAAAIGLLVKQAIDQADAMSKSAQKSGLTTEALSRLAWAGNLSDVSLETLTMSLGRLSNVMATVASGKGKDVKAIFDALGIAVTEADGRMRSTDAVMADLADVFASMADGADKTALAIKIFGRAGADLIPLLNSGRDGLSEMAAEADRLGITISTDMGKQAEEFNDTMTRIGAVLQGMAVKIAGMALPYLNELAAKLNDPEFVAGAQAMARDVGDAFRWIITGIQEVIGWMRTLGEWWDKLKGWVEWARTHDMFGNPLSAEELKRVTVDLSPRPAVNDNNFDERFQGQLPGKGDRPTPPPKKPRTFNLGGLLGEDDGSGGDKAADDAIAKLEAQKQAVTDLIARLEEERDIQRETDPVQREMIRLRETLAVATDEQKKKVEELIATTLRERETMEAAQEASRAFSEIAFDGLDDLIAGGKSLEETLQGVYKSLVQLVLQAALLGQGPLAGLFGTAGSAKSGGPLGSLLSGLFAGFRANGGLIPSGTFGIVGERGPEPVIGTARGAMVLPNSSLRGMGGGTNVTVNISTPNAESFRASQSQVSAQLARAVARGQRNL